MSLRDFLNIWQNFWFKPESPLTMCVFRIVFGLVFLTQITTQYWIDFSVFFGAHPVIPYEDYTAFWWKKDIHINMFEFIPIGDAWHIGLLVITAIFALAMILGFYTRLSTFFCWLLYCSICHQYPYLCNAGDNMQRVALFLLCFTRAGDGLSIDSYLKNRKNDWRKAVFDPAPVAPWAQRMLQVQMALAYISTGLLKINSPVWFYGNGCYLATRLSDFAKLPVPVIFEHRIPLYILNWFTILIEFAAGTLIWIKEIKYWIILLGVILHLGIDWALNIPVFEFAFMSMYILFIEPEDMKKFGHWFKLLAQRIFRQLKFSNARA